MTRIEFAPAVAEDFDRIFDHLAHHDAAHAAARIGQIVDAIDVLQQSPRIGRPIERDLRELVIGRKSHGYVALYRYVELIDTSSGSPSEVRRKRVTQDERLQYQVLIGADVCNRAGDGRTIESGRSHLMRRGDGDSSHPHAERLP